MNSSMQSEIILQTKILRIIHEIVTHFEKRISPGMQWPSYQSYMVSILFLFM